MDTKSGLIILTKDNIEIYKEKVRNFIDDLMQLSISNCKRNCSPTAPKCVSCEIPSLRKDIEKTVTEALEKFTLDGIWVYNMKRLRENYILSQTGQIDTLNKFIQADVLRAIGFESAEITENIVYYIKPENSKFVLKEANETRIKTKYEIAKTVDVPVPDDIFKYSIFKGYSRSYCVFYSKKDKAQKFVDRLNQQIEDNIIKLQSCKDCGVWFILDAKDLAYFEKKNKVPLIRCKKCRELKKILMADCTCETCGKIFRQGNYYTKQPDKNSVIKHCKRCLTPEDRQVIKNNEFKKYNLSEVNKDVYGE